MLIFLFGFFLALVFLGLPIAHAILPPILVVAIFYLGMQPKAIASILVNAVDAWIWLTMPLFLMMSNASNETGITSRLLDVCQDLFGHIRGAISHVNVAVSVLMAGIQGSASADAASIGSILIPPTKEAGYPAGYASAITATSSVIGPLIPPSVGLIIIAVLGRLSVLRLWLGGVIPGLLLGIGLIFTGYIVARRKNFPRMGQRSSLRRVSKSVTRAAPALVVPFVIIGGMRLGIFTPTEAGAVGVVYILLIGTFVYRQLTFQGLRHILQKTVELVGSVFWLIAMALLFGIILGRFNLAEQLIVFLTGFTSSAIAFKFILAIMLLFLGCIMDSAPIYLILFPVLLPVAQAYGIDPIYFGVLFYYNAIIGQCTPPVGVSMFISNSIANCTVKEYITEAWPLLATQYALLPAFLFFPPLITWFPNLVMG